MDSHIILSTRSYNIQEHSAIRPAQKPISSLPLHTFVKLPTANHQSVCVQDEDLESASYPIILPISAVGSAHGFLSKVL